MTIQEIRKAQNTLRAAIAICEAKGGVQAAVDTVNQALIGSITHRCTRYKEVMEHITYLKMVLRTELRNAEFAAGYPVDEETGCDLREWSGNSIAAAHDEALRIDAQMHQDEFANASTMMRAVWVNLNHAEANTMNKPYYALTQDDIRAIRDRVQRGCMHFNEGMWMLAQQYAAAKEFYNEDK